MEELWYNTLMSTKKWIALVIFVVTLIVALCAAYMIARQDIYIPPENTAATAAPSAAPEPTEPPLPPLVACVMDGADEAFRAALDSVAGIDLMETSLQELSGMAEVDLAVLYLAAPPEDTAQIAALLERGIPVLAYNRTGAELPDAVTEIGWKVAAPATAEAALEAAIAYPPHDTPVRMFGVFERTDGAAYAAWTAAVDGGRILNKGVFAPGKGTLAAWIAERLEEFYPGMVDAAFVESPAQAAELAAAMIAQERDDFEIFTVGSDAALAGLAAEHPGILPSGASVDDEAAAQACVAALGEILAGKTPEDLLLDGGEGAD